MPTAKFQADFSDFLNKTREASGSLEKLADAAGSTSGSLSKVGSSFTGEALIRKAVDTAAAIEKIGGASALTEREMVRVNATVTEAISKLGALGAKAPKELTDLASATQAAADKSKLLGSGIDVARLASDAFGTAMKSAMTTLLPLLTFTEFVRLGKEAVAFAGTISDMSAKTGIGVEALQQFKYAGEQVGVSLDTITGATAMLQKRIAGGDEGVARAIQKMGMSFNDFANLKPEDQLLRIAKHAESVTNPIERTQFGVEALGKSFAEVSPLLVSGLEEMTQKATSLGIVMDEKTVAAMDNVGDSFSTLTSVGMALIGKVIAPFIPLLNLSLSALLKLGDGVMSVVTPAVEFLAKAWLGFLIKLAEGLKWISDAIPGFNALTGASDALGTAIGSMQNALDQMSNGMQATQTETKNVATEFNVTSDAAKKHADEIAKLADKYGANGLTKDALDLVQALKQITDMTKLSSDQQAKLAKDVIELGNQYRALGKEVPAHIQALIDQSLRLVMIPEMLKKGNEEARKEFERITKEFVDSTSKLSDEASKQSLKTLSDALSAGQKVSEEFDKATLTSFELAVKHAEKWRDDTLKAIEPLKTSFPALYAELGAQVQTVYAKMVEDAQTSASEQLSGFSKIFGDLPGVIAKAIQGGGSIKAAIMNSVGGNLFDPQDGALGKMLSGGVNKLASSLQSSLGQDLAGKIGQGLFSLIPMVGSMMGPLTSVIGAGLSKLFGGVSKEVRQARDEISGMEKQLASTLTASQQLEAGNERWKMTTIAVRDAYLATGRSAADAEAIVRQLWDDSKPQKVKEAIQQINAVMDEQKAAQNALNEAISRYGFKIEELGPTLQRQKLSEMVQQLMKDFALLTAAGIDVNLVTERMSGSINEYVRLALKTGQEVPASMKPILEKMIEMGLLTDENGEKITDLSKIPFSETMTQGFDRVVSAIDRLIKVIGGGLDQAASDLVDFTDTVGNAVNNLPSGYTLRVNLTAGDTSGLTTAVASAVTQSVTSAAAVMQKLGLTWSGIGGSGGGSGDGGPSGGQQTTLAEFLKRNGLQDINRFIDANTNKDIWGENITDPGLLAEARNKADNEARQFKKDNPDLFNPDGTPKKFAMGTKGTTGRWFNNFGVGTPAILHGDEAVVRKDQAGEFAATFGSDSGVLDELANIRTSLSALPQHIARAVRDAVLVAG